jgi:hypothetical protein
MRARHGNTARPTRFQGEVSGVTFATSPSGVTIYKNEVQTNDGYILHHDTSGEKLKMGVLACSGTSLDRQTLGLSTINHVVATATVKRSGATAITVVVTAAKEAFSGATEVCFFVYHGTGIAYPSACSIQYWAVGT